MRENQHPQDQIRTVSRQSTYFDISAVFSLTVSDTDNPADFNRLLDGLNLTLHDRVSILEQEMAANEHINGNYPNLNADERVKRTIIRETALTVSGRRLAIELTIMPRVRVTSTGLVTIANTLLANLESVMHDVLDHEQVMSEVMGRCQQMMPRPIRDTTLIIMGRLGKQVGDLLDQYSTGQFTFTHERPAYHGASQPSS